MILDGVDIKISKTFKNLIKEPRWHYMMKLKEGAKVNVIKKDKILNNKSHTTVKVHASIKTKIMSRNCQAALPRKQKYQYNACGF